MIIADEPTFETSIGITHMIINGKYQATNVVNVTRMCCFLQLPKCQCRVATRQHTATMSTASGIPVISALVIYYSTCTIDAI